ncbi:MAG TPA: GNAT family N-acetyltransferase [Anaerolineales bacterium]|nr:GNAT family N-acetyltransferase [Anaerolineales bacterium]
MEIDLEKLEVIHVPAKNRFETWIDNQLSKLDYFLDEDTMVITHVGVYPEHRGQGVAGKITEAALKYAEENSLRVIPMCPYVATYIRRHPHYIALTRQSNTE